MKTGHAANTCRHGFATFAAVVLISILAMALLALTLLFQADTRRSMRHGGEAQLRQLLVAGGAAAVRAVSADQSITGTHELPVPDALEDAAVVIEFQPGSPDVLRATVTARIGTRQAVEALTFMRHDTGWVLRDAQLERPY